MFRSTAAQRLCSRGDNRLHGTSGYGTVHFANSCTAAVQPALQLAIAKLHSFEADPADFISAWRSAIPAARSPGGARR